MCPTRLLPPAKRAPGKCRWRSTGRSYRREGVMHGQRQRRRPSRRAALSRSLKASITRQPTPRGRCRRHSQSVGGASASRPADGEPGRAVSDCMKKGCRRFQAQDREAALRNFAEAWKYQDQLDPETRQQLKDKLTLLRASSDAPRPLAGGRAAVAAGTSQFAAGSAAGRSSSARLAERRKSGRSAGQKDPEAGAGQSAEAPRPRVGAPRSSRPRKK